MALKTTEISTATKNKKIIFGEDGSEVNNSTESSSAVSDHKKKKKKNKDKAEPTVTVPKEEDGIEDETAEDDEDDYFAKREEKKKAKNKSNEDLDSQKKWYHVYRQYPISEEIADIKDSEQMELYNTCRTAYEQEKPIFTKRNPSDARWLQTAIHKGTAKDRANAGALLVTSNPLANLEALSTLIGFTKLSNKSSSDVISIVTDLWKEILLPPYRKLYSLQMRGADWKIVRKDSNLTKEQQRRIYAYWHFENELKDQYFEFLKNIQQGIQTGQENNKTSSIIAASQLLCYAPEKEQMLLTMLINKLGDPVAKIASKALHHLIDVAHRHPNMCAVIVSETEKLLFRNNISDRAQHFALCYLASIAPAGRSEVCTKLVNICFSLFKVLVQKGAVNNRTMQAILRCLQKAILDAKPPAGSTEILSKDMQDTVYRLVHLADIRVSIQTLGLLLQLVTVKSEKNDRFYNALYVKLLDMNLTTIGTKTSAQLLHIVHRAIHIDGNVARAQAFIKRLLQLALYMPTNIGSGCLIVIHKLLRSRKELASEDNSSENVSTNGSAAISSVVQLPKVSANDEELSKFDDSDGEEKYEDIDEESKVIETGVVKTETATTSSSWHHAKVSSLTNNENKVREFSASKYDPYHRVPAFAGAEFALRNELLLLREHFHPTVQVFADNILNGKRIDYYGDPLRDFGLPHFLERFAFKNPKKLDQQKAEATALSHKRYVSHGARGMPVKSLTKLNCTEDEMFIFNFLEQKRKQSVTNKKDKKTDDDDEDGDDDDVDPNKGDVDDDEFEQYLDGFFGKKAQSAPEAEELEAGSEDEEELDFLKELGGELKQDTKKKAKKKTKIGDDEEDEMDDIDADWGDDDEMENFEAGDASDDEEGSIDFNENSDDDDDGGSVSLDEDVANDEDDSDNDEDDDDGSDNGDDDSDNDDDDDMLLSSKSKLKRKTSMINERDFSKKLKHSDGNMSSLFAAADDFAELLEETGKAKDHGTINAVFNKDKSSDKQMKWEENRRSNTKTYKSKKFKNNKFSKQKKQK